jgi:hypothetical protein
MEIREIQNRLCYGAGHWEAGLQYYDCIQSITFWHDGTGELVYGGGGQVIRLIVNFAYQIIDENHLSIEYFDTDDKFWGRMFRRTEGNITKIVAFHLHQGDFIVDEPYTKKGTLRFKLMFESDPFPHTSYATQDLLDYYGGRVMTRQGCMVCVYATQPTKPLQEEIGSALSIYCEKHRIKVWRAHDCFCRDLADPHGLTNISKIEARLSPDELYIWEGTIDINAQNFLPVAKFADYNQLSQQDKEEKFNESQKKVHAELKLLLNKRK